MHPKCDILICTAIGMQDLTLSRKESVLIRNDLSDKRSEIGKIRLNGRRNRRGMKEFPIIFKIDCILGIGKKTPLIDLFSFVRNTR